jgi:hypothetical protein
MSNRLIGITGRKGSGKDTVGAILRTLYGYRTLAYADPLKRACRDIYGLTVEQTDGPLAVKEAVDPRWGLSPREIMQRFGTEVGRSIHTETWTRAAMLRVEAEPGWWAITDVRFDNEAEVIHARGGIVLRVDRPGLGEGVGAGHASEAVEQIPVDFVIVNDGTMLDLAGKVRAILDRSAR